MTTTLAPRQETKRHAAVRPAACFHIGLPKTGTKTLQIHVFSQHPQIEYLGKLVLGKHGSQYKHQAAATLLEELWHANWAKPNLDLCRQAYQEAVAPAQDAGRVPVCSWEAMSGGSREARRAQARNYKAVFGECKMLISLRQPLDLAECLFFQDLKRITVGAGAGWGKGFRHPDINQWLKSKFRREGRRKFGGKGRLEEQSPWGRLDYAETVRIFAEEFGRENIGVFVFEQLKENALEYLKSICRFIGVDPECVQDASEKRENTRWTVDHMQRLDHVQSSWWRSFKFRFGSPRYRRRTIGVNNDEACAGKRAKAAISDEHKKHIQDLTREGNRWLVKNWRLPLEKYGYAV